MERLRKISLSEWFCGAACLYIVFIVWQFREVRFMGEPSTELFDIFNYQRFSIPVSRYSHQLPQAVPLLLSMLGFKMSVIANAYNLCEGLILIVPAIFGLAVRKAHYAIVAILSVFTMFGTNFNTLGMEMTYAPALILLWIWCFEHIKIKWIWLLLHFALSFYIIYGHPLAISAWLLTGGFYLAFYQQSPFDRSKSFIALEAVPVLFMLLCRIFTLPEYDVQRLVAFTTNVYQHTFKPLNNPFFDWLFIAAFLWLMIKWYRQSAYIKMGLLAMIVILNYVMVAVMNKGFFPEYCQRDPYKLMLPLLLLIATVSAFELYRSFGNRVFNNILFLIISVILIARGTEHFFRCSFLQTQCREYILNQIARLQNVEGQKFYLSCECKQVDNSWCQCYTGHGSETIFLSLYYDFPKPVSLIFADEIRANQLLELPENRLYFNGGWTNEIAGQRSKPLFNNEPYREVDCN